MGSSTLRTLKRYWIGLRTGFWDGLLVGAKYGALTGTIVACLIWILFRSFDGFFLGSLLGLGYGTLTGGLIGGMMGATLALHRDSASVFQPSFTWRRPCVWVGILFGALGGWLFVGHLAGLGVGIIVGSVITFLLVTQVLKVPETFAERVMSDPELLFGTLVYTIFGGLVGAIVGAAIAAWVGGLNGALLGAVLGLAIGHSKQQRPPELREGPSTQLP